jgi:cell division protease FtsH
MDKGSTRSNRGTPVATLRRLWRKLARSLQKLHRPSPPEVEINPPEPVDAPARGGRSLLLFVLLVLAALYLWRGVEETRQNEITYSEFMQFVRQQRVADVVVSDKFITGVITPEVGATGRRQFVTLPLWNAELAKLLDDHGIRYSVVYSSNWLSNFIFNWLLPIGVMVAIWSFMARRMASAAGSGFLNIGRNRAHIHADKSGSVTFREVAGAAEAKQELMESIEFLRDPVHIQRLGGHMPKGVLLVGPPGTGKTLLARAVAGEAGVPFFNISGAEFIELFVGVGAARMRDLFEQARQQAPCMIFIDELDAIGRARGGPLIMGGHDEREQTLNQLLTEMDGFDPSGGVVVMAATNRPEILDRALLRAGRFDRQIVVDKPGLEDRVAILQLHSQPLTLVQDINLRIVAQRTPGLVGADLANICNEAAIIAVRENAVAIRLQDFEAAIDRIMAGPEKKSLTLSETEKHRVACHEAGHALVAEIVPTGEPVHKVSIIPRGAAALGFTLQLPVEEKFLSTEPEMKDQLAILLAGRSAEDLVFGDVSSGAHNDLEKASAIARAMVCELGMSRRLGPLTYGKRQQLAYLGVEGAEERNFSDETAQLIDNEVRDLIEEAQQRAIGILTEYRATLDAITRELQAREVMDGEAVKAMIHQQGSRAA